MRRFTRRARLVIFALAFLPQNNAVAFEGPTTHAGITGKAALASRLHRSLTKAGHVLGLFETLQFDRTKAPKLAGYLRRLDPEGGFRPGDDFKQTALAWLLAGSAIADLPPKARLNHYYNAQVETQPGLSNRTAFTEFKGESALKWIRAGANPQSLQRFEEAWRKATVLKEAKASQHYRAIALVALGGILHVLQDMAVPSHTRNDYATGHFQRLGNSAFDRGSSFERLVGQLFGRLAIPAYRGPAIRFDGVDSYFANTDHRGLADRVSRTSFSPGTLPHSTKLLSGVNLNRLRKTLARGLSLPLPELPPFDIVAAQIGVQYLKNNKHLLAAYVLDAQDTLRFFIDRHVQISTARAVVPLAVGYSSGLIDLLINRAEAIEKRMPTSLKSR